jgi:DNA-binding NarL/FixJ family response regulator
VGIRIFLVEDAKHMQGVLGELLQTVGQFEIVANMATEAEARLWIEEHPGAWDIAVIDLILEQGTGMGVISRARAAAGDGGRVVVLSDYATPGIRQHCIDLGADAVFQKSLDMPAFMAYCGSLSDPIAASP